MMAIHTDPAEVPETLASLLVHRFGAHADEPTIDGVLELADEGVVHLHECTAKSSGATVQVVTLHLGDTRVGLISLDGQEVAGVSDCEIR